MRKSHSVFSLNEGMTLFVSSHLLSEIEHICDHVVMIRNGQSVFQGSVADLRGMRTAELVLRAEDPNQLSLLAQLVREKGLGAEIEEERGRSLSLTGAPWPAS